jgi:hypothetical protein
MLPGEIKFTQRKKGVSGLSIVIAQKSLDVLQAGCRSEGLARCELYELLLITDMQLHILRHHPHGRYPPV